MRPKLDNLDSYSQCISKCIVSIRKTQHNVGQFLVSRIVKFTFYGSHIKLKGKLTFYNLC